MKLPNIINVILAVALAGAIVISVDLWGELQEAWIMMSPSGECRAEITARVDKVECDCSWTVNGKLIHIPPPNEKLAGDPVAEAERDKKGDK